MDSPKGALCRVMVPSEGGNTYYAVYAQSRNRFLTVEEDNQGFGKWVYEYAEELVEFLGVGHHYGEWWGSKIQRAYGLTNGERYFSLFNHRRWASAFGNGTYPVPGLRLVPLLYEGPWDEYEIDSAMEELESRGSYAQPFYGNPEGIVVFDTLTGNFYKKTFDDNHKGVTNAGS